MEPYAELNGYKDPENQQKANEIRKLVNEGMKTFDKRESKRILKQAEFLSYELATYLKENYPAKFNIHYYTLPKDMPIDAFIRDFKVKGKIFQNIIETISPQIHDIVFVKDTGIKFQGIEAVGIFFDESSDQRIGIPHIGSPGFLSLAGPDEWYDFIERMALYSDSTTFLYMESPDIGVTMFYYKDDKWPLKIEIKERIM